MKQVEDVAELEESKDVDGARIFDAADDVGEGNALVVTLLP